jgi:hypothetical protein
MLLGIYTSILAPFIISSILKVLNTEISIKSRPCHYLRVITEKIICYCHLSSVS